MGIRSGKKSLQECKHHIMICDLAITNDDESDGVIAENAADKADVKSDVEYSNAPSEVVLAVSSKVADVLEQQQSTTIVDLEEQIATLTKHLHQA